MKKIAFSIATLLTAFGTSAFAADMPLAKAPPVVAAIPFTWTGIYVGGHIGYGATTESWYSNDLITTGNTPNPFGLGTERFDGGVAGGQVGARYQVGSIVVGVEGAYSWAEIDGKSCTPTNPLPAAHYSCRSHVDGIASVTGQFGVAYERALFYLKGGGAWVRTNDSMEVFLDVGPPVTLQLLTPTTWRTGWTMGAGFEWAFSNNWSARAEYDYISLGTRSTPFLAAVPGATPVRVDITEHLHTVKLGINYRFGWGQ